MGLIQHIRNAAGVTIDPKWIQGIRKSWKNVISQVARVKERNEGLDSAEAIDNALRYLALLQQDLFFGKGLYPFQGGNRTLQEQLKDKAPFNIQAKVSVHLEAAREALEEGKRRIKFWMAVTNPQTHEYKMDGGRRVKEIVEDERFKGRSEGQAIMKFLNWQSPLEAQDAAKKADAEISGKLLRALTSFTVKYPGMDIGTGVDREFSVGRMKVVFEDVPTQYLKGLSPEAIEEIRSPQIAKRYVKPMANAQTLLKKKGLDFLWYGVTRILCKTCGGKNPLDTVDKVWGVGGDYSIGKDRINVYVDPKTFVTELMVHELGHRYYYKFMSMADRAEFSSYFGQVPGVSDYGKTISAEDFAEVFAWYVLNRNLTSDQLGRFKKFLGRKKQRGASAEKGPLDDKPGLIKKLREWRDKYVDVADEADDEAAEDTKDWYETYFDEAVWTRNGGVIATVKRLAKSTGGLKGPVKDKWGNDSYTMDISKDRFIHFTTPEAAKAIVNSKKLLVSPPGVRHFGPVGVFAVSLVWGWYLPGVQLTHIKSPHIVAVLFTTDTKPRPSNTHEEVVWHTDVPLKTAKIVSKGEAIRLLKKVPFPLKDEEALVSYV
jgi:hypothetical protein